MIRLGMFYLVTTSPAVVVFPGWCQCGVRFRSYLCSQGCVETQSGVGSQGGMGQVGVRTGMWCGNPRGSGSGRFWGLGLWMVCEVRVEWIALGFMVIPLHMGCDIRPTPFQSWCSPSYPQAPTRFSGVLRSSGKSIDMTQEK